MKCSAIIFDLDGTLLDTLDDIADSTNEVLRRGGWPTHPNGAYRQFVGDGVTVLFQRVLPAVDKNPETVSRCVESFREVYGAHWNARSKPYEGVLPLLETLQAKGIRLTVLSNKPHEFTVRCVDAYFPAGIFELVFGQREGVPRKPDPAGALEIVERLGIPASRIAYVGDSSIDMQTARAAKLHVIGALWGFRPREELVAHGAEVLIAHPMELLPWLDIEA